MKKLPKLYTKNDKGRYEAYQIPYLDLSDTLFRKINGKKCLYPRSKRTKANRY